VQVRDAESKQPISGAQVKVWHPAAHASPTSGTTGADGLASVPAPPAENSPLFYEVTAKGYLPRPPEQKVQQTSSGAVIELYAGPEPTLEVVLPPNYRGGIRLTVRIKNDLPYTPGTRTFSFPLPPSAEIEAVLPPIFLRGVTPNIVVRDQSGTKLSRSAKDYDSGCRCLKSDPESEYIFFIGTQYEADQFQRQLMKTNYYVKPNVNAPVGGQ
jgi:hypothetical protein